MSKLLDITVEATGIKETRAKMGLAVSLLGDLKALWREVFHPWMLRHMEQQFATDGRHGGKPWPGYPSQPRYVAYKLGTVGHLDPLRWDKSGGRERLYPSLTEPRHRYGVRTSRRHKASFGTRLWYGKRLRYGGTNLFDEPHPGYEMFAMRSTQRRDLIRQMQRWVVANIDRDTFRRARGAGTL